ncbi:alpha/beta fold hydrolase [Candidatus Woesearchaeota archaeon]|nr:alpha/beta fold hydrolase [Candidatus Woesearchaeota archaeon]
MNKNNKLLIFTLLLVIALSALNAEYIISTTKSKIIQSSVEDSFGEAPLGTYPLILLHGYNPIYSRRIAEISLKDMQSELSDDLGYVNKGILTSETTCSELHYSKDPIVIRATYLNKLEIDEIDEYTNNVAKIISKVKECTGAEKVDLITHSMGGIVVRNYIEHNDSSSIRKFIMLGTPNHGGLYNLGEFADYFVEEGESKINLDFIMLSENHNFMKSLNDGDETSGNVEYYTIAGNIDGKGDGLVLSKSVSLDGEDNHLEVSCNHLQLKYPSSCLESYDFIKKVLS